MSGVLALAWRPDSQRPWRVSPFPGEDGLWLRLSNSRGAMSSSHPGASALPGAAGGRRGLRPERLAESGIDPSVGTVGDAYDAPAETVIGLFKPELIKPSRPGGAWRCLDRPSSTGG